MSDLPMPQDAAEAVQFAECWDAVLCYADLCAAGSAAAARLATEAFTRGTREARGPGARTGSGPGHRPVRLLPRVPLLLTAVRTTAAAWEAAGRGDDLDPGLRRWLASAPAARYTGPPAGRPLALRALRGMPLPDAELLWLAEVEALPLPVVARRLGLDPAGTAAELAQARAIFRDRLSLHLSGCADRAEAVGGPGAALADGVLGWGGPAYLERRRRAAEARRGAGRPAPADEDGGPPDHGTRRTRAVRGGLLVTAVLASLLALTASLHPFGDADASDGSGAAPAATPDGRPASPSTAAVPPRPVPAGSESATPLRDPEPRAAGAAPRATASAPPSCRVHYDLVTQWPAGFQAAVTVTTVHALDTWRVTWTFPDGQEIGQMWDATLSRSGRRVTAASAPYNSTVPAHGTLSFGFLASWEGDHGGPEGPEGVALNGRACAME